MLVAIFVWNLGGGGAERVALTSANDLIARGHDVDLVLITGGGELLPLLSPKVRVIELRAPRRIASLPRLIRYLRKRRPDALHAIMWPNTIIAVLAHRLARSRARLTVSDHTHYSQHFAQSGHGKELRNFRWTTRLFYPLADVRIACSAAAADDLAGLAHIPRDHIDVVYSPISPPSTLAKTKEAEALWRGAAKKILNIGSMNPVKNQALLLRAFARLDDPEAVLVILGDGAERGRLEALALDLGIADRVVMPGFVVDPWPYLAAADLFVLSSNYEGSPVALAEAMYAGLNVASTDCVSGPAELLDGGRLGELAPCNDEAALAEAMRRALARTPDPQTMRNRALEMTGSASVARYFELVTGG
ncbi:glycosyltransferase [Sphingomonas alba]|uniref:Glycosyltransferase n=1 Tax=Sphingomonas alba TaxID=2908208 RepID=A0ABT0RJC7_9SPHN|nr:glycosyltransferase [Sphingomonas alba]MCL6682705.1 glycosyltransferase [Sphingomonas alba]